MSEKYKFNDPAGMYFVTMGIVHWIDLFTRKELKYVIVDSLQHCQQHKGLIIYAWCLMPSHLHMIVSSKQETLSGIIRDLKKFTAKKLVRVITEINESRKVWLLNAFRKSGQSLKRISEYKVWQDGNHPEQLVSNQFMEQKLNYIHQNPVEVGIVDEAEHYLYSSARDYAGRRGLLEVELIA